MMYSTSLVVVLCLAVSVSGHGRLRDPPSRASMWRDGFKSRPDWDDDQAYCGGLEYKVQMGGKCGVCGDPWDQSEPREHELGGIYGKGTITRNYTRGQIIDTWVQLTTNHGGWFTFRICPLKNPGPGHDATQECLDEHPLTIAGTSETTMKIDHSTMNFHLKLKLPDDVTCEHCFFQWDWLCGNQWGICPDGRGAMGCGPQETFRGCADISIS